MWRALIGSAVLLFAILGPASADGIQAQCGSESGTAFAARGGLVGDAQAGWYDDTTTGETVIRIDADNGVADVRFRDATGVWQSVSDQGGSTGVFATVNDPLAFTVLVSYPATTIEVLTIAEISGSSAVLIHTVSRTTDRITNSRVMTARCLLTAY
jgi:hypothetical protein